MDSAIYEFFQSLSELLSTSSWEQLFFWSFLLITYVVVKTIIICFCLAFGIYSIGKLFNITVWIYEKINKTEEKLLSLLRRIKTA